MLKSIIHRNCNLNAVEGSRHFNLNIVEMQDNFGLMCPVYKYAPPSQIPTYLFKCTYTIYTPPKKKKHAAAIPTTPEN